MGNCQSCCCCNCGCDYKDDKDDKDENNKPKYDMPINSVEEQIDKTLKEMRREEEEENEKKKKILNDKENKLNEREKQLNDRQNKLDERENILNDRQNKINELNDKENKLDERENKLNDLNDKENKLNERENILNERENKLNDLNDKENKLNERENKLNEREHKLNDLNDRQNKLNERENKLNDKDNKLNIKEKSLNEKENIQNNKEKEISNKQNELNKKENELNMKNNEINIKEKSLEEKGNKQMEKEKEIVKKEKELNEKDKQLNLKDNKIIQKEKLLKEKEKDISDKEKILIDKDNKLNIKNNENNQKEKILNEKQNKIKEKEEENKKKEKSLIEKEKKLNDDFNIKHKEKEKEINDKKKLLIEKENKLNKEIQDKQKKIEEKEEKLKNDFKNLEIQKKEFENEKKLEKMPILVGLDNIGATCYMNATLQSLSNTDRLTDYFLKNYQYNPNDNTKKISNEYYKLVINLWDKNKTNQSFPPEDFKTTLSKENPLFQGIQANDSKDLINFLLERLHQELNNPINNNIDYTYVNQLNEMESLKCFLQEFQQNYRSIISDLFYGILETKSKCTMCQNIKYNFQVFSFLEFPLAEVNNFCFNNGRRMSLVNNDGSNPDVDLYECFDYYQKVDLMTGDNRMYCNICQGILDSYYSTSLYSAPNYLIINLNRGKNAYYQCRVNFPEQLNLLNYVSFKNGVTCYNLYAVICHYGESSMSGHFMAFCRHKKDNNWYLYNDSMVSKCTKPKQYNDGMPYILFYKAA